MKLKNKLKSFKKVVDINIISDKIRKSLKGDKINEEMVFEN